MSLFEGSETGFILIPCILGSFFETTTCQHSYTIIVSTLYLSFLWLLKNQHEATEESYYRKKTALAVVTLHDCSCSEGKNLSTYY